MKFINLRIPKGRRKDVFIVLLLFVVALLVAGKEKIVITDRVNYTILVLGALFLLYARQQQKKECPGYFERNDIIREAMAKGTDYQFAIDNFSSHRVESKALVHRVRYVHTFPEAKTSVVFDNNVRGYIDEVRFLELGEYTKEIEESELMKGGLKELTKKEKQKEKLIKEGYTPEQANEIIDKGSKK